MAVYVSMDNTVVIEDISECTVCLPFWVVGVRSFLIIQKSGVRDRYIDRYTGRERHRQRQIDRQTDMAGS